MDKELSTPPRKVLISEWLSPVYRYIEERAEQLIERYNFSSLERVMHQSAHETVFNILCKYAYVRRSENRIDHLETFLYEKYMMPEPLKNPPVTFMPSFEEALQYMSPLDAAKLFLESDPTELANLEDFFIGLLQVETSLYLLDELRGALCSFVKFLDKNSNALIERGEPEFEFEESPWINLSLSRLYQKDPALRPTEEWRINRSELYALKLNILDEVIKVLEKKNASELWPECVKRFREHGFTDPKKAEFYLKLDALYLALQRQHGKRLSSESVIYSGGISNIFDLVFHVKNEIEFGKQRRKREVLIGLIEKSDKQPPRFRQDKRNFFQLNDAEIGLIADLHSEFMDDFFHDPWSERSPEDEENMDAMLVNRLLGLPARTPNSKNHRDVVFYQKSDVLFTKVMQAKLVHSPDYRLVWYEKADEPLVLDDGEKEVVKILNEVFGDAPVPHTEEEILVKMPPRPDGTNYKSLRDVMRMRIGSKRPWRKAVASGLVDFFKSGKTHYYRLNI